MALSKIIFSLYPFLSSFPLEVGGQILFLAHKQETEKAFEAYLDYSKEINAQDFQLLTQAAVQLLRQGIENADSEIRLMSIFGAGVAMSMDLLPVLEKGLFSKDLRMQILAVNYLSRLKDDEADRLLIESLSSPFLLTRLEALNSLSKKNYPNILSHLQALIAKVPKAARAIFPQIAIHLEGGHAHAFLRQLLTDSDSLVRMETLMAIAKAKRDDFLPHIRNLASTTQHVEQECAVYALGKLKDNSALPLLKELTRSVHVEIRLAAAVALYEMGQKDFLSIIEGEAEQGNVFAINALGNLEVNEELLQKLSMHRERDIRLNAVFSLLRMKKCKNVEEFLISSPRDIGFMPQLSPGGALKAWKTVPLASQRGKTFPGVMAKTLALKETLLLMALECAEEDFLKIAKLIFNKQQTDLIPLVVQLLANMTHPEALDILKEGHQKAGSPFLRNWCTLALYKMGENGRYEEELIQWVLSTKEHPLIQFREEENEDSGGLTPDETSRFLVEVFETLASSQNQNAINALIHAIAYGNPKNRYALAGLLIKAIE